MTKPSSIFYEEISYLRATACIMVVIVHVTAINYDYSASMFGDSLSLYLNQISRLGTPIFAFISAFLIIGSIKNKNRFSHKDFFISRTLKIVIPFVAWSIFYIWFSSYYFGKDIKADSQSVVQYLFFGNAFYHLYFISTVIQFYLIVPLIAKIKKRVDFAFLFLASIPINYIFSTRKLSNLFTELGFMGEILNSGAFLFNWISYFLLGACVSLYYKVIIDVLQEKTKIIATIFTLSLIALYLDIKPGSIFPSSRTENIFYIPVITLSLLCFIVTTLNKGTKIKAIRAIGDYSMGIYLIHPLVIILFYRMTSHNLWTSYYILFTAGCVILLSCVAIWLISKLPYSYLIVPLGRKK